MNPVWHFVNGVPTIGAANIGPLAISPSAVTSGVRLNVDNTTVAGPAQVINRTNTSSYNFIRFDTNNVGKFEIGADPDQASGETLVITSTVGSGLGMRIPQATGLPNFPAGLNTTGSNGQSLNVLQSLTELTTIAAAATTDTTIQMPANSVVLGVSVRVTVAIPTATNFTVGDSGSAARFSTAAVSVAANSTDPGTKAGAYYNATALSVRITPDGTPAANTGRVRVTIYYYSVTPPTS